MASPIDLALAEIKNHFGESEGLMSDLAADAVWARARDDEFEECLSRLMELWALRQLAPVDAHEVLAEVRARWAEFTPSQARSIEHLADALWAETLILYPHDPSADLLLGELQFLELPMVRWLEPWLNSLDGAGAKHLADSILRPTNSQAWAMKPDERRQLESWASSEPVVMGLAVVGGVHLDEGDFAALLDRLV